MPSFFNASIMLCTAVLVWFCASATVGAFFVTPKSINAVSGTAVVFPVPSTLKRFAFVVWIEFTANGIGPAILKYRKRKTKINSAVKNGILSSFQVLFMTCLFGFEIFFSVAYFYINWFIFFTQGAFFFIIGLSLQNRQ